MGTIRDQIASNIKKFRTEKKMSVDEVGMAVGKSGKTISAWEVGRGQPDADAIIRLCRIFEVDIADFYGMTDSEEDPTERELIDLYRSLDIFGREAVLTVALTLVRKSAERRNLEGSKQ